MDKFFKEKQYAFDIIQERYGDMLVKGPVGVVIDEWDFRMQQRY